MSQPNETTFNAQSPRSSSGGGDSYKHEGTPDTRLTAFSPGDGPAGATRLPEVAAGKQTATPEGHGQFHSFPGAAYSATPSGEEKDPFVSSEKPQPKLSPTASAFMPVAIPMMAQGSLTGQVVYHPAAGVQPMGVQYNARFSSEVGIYHHLAISSVGASLKTGDVEEYLEVCDVKFNPSHASGLGMPQLTPTKALVPRETKNYGRYTIVSDGRQMYVRFANVQYARIAHDCVRFRPQWKAVYIAHADYFQVKNSLYCHATSS